MDVGTYFTTGSITESLGFMIQAESRVRLGTEYLFGALETSSWTYSTYGTSIGLKAGKAIDFGQVESLGFTHQPSFEPLESANVQQPSIYVLSGEETTLNVGVRQFDPRVLQVALGTAGALYSLGNEYLIPFGGACTASSRPVEVGVLNIGCNRPASPDAVSSGITAIILTLYDVQATSGLDWGDIVANEVNQFDLELAAKPVLTNALGNRLGNLYIF
jgi:hypothetical protein